MGGGHLNRGSKDRSPATSVTTTTRRDSGNEAQEAKRKLEELFGGAKASPPPSEPPQARTRTPSGPIRRTPSGKVFASPRKSTGRTPSDYRLRLERLRIAREPAEIQTAADAFLEHHQLPDDIDVLYKVLLHPSEKVVREALGQISSLLMQGRLSGTLLLEDRLRHLTQTSQQDATKSYIDGLWAQLESIKRSGG